ncbi:MAG: hypothetical protein ABJA74_13365 [Lapillicoccus sp.]
MSTPTPAALLAVADRRARNLITSDDPATLRQWEAFDDTLYRLLHALVGPGRQTTPREDSISRDILTTFRSYPTPIRPARGETYSLHEAARLQGLPVNRVAARVRRGQIDTHTLRTGRRAWIIDADQLDTRTDVTPANADDPHPLARLSASLGALADLYTPANDDTRAPDIRPVDDHDTAATMRHVLSIASVAARHTLTHLPIADATRPLQIAQYADHALDTLKPAQSSQPAGPIRDQPWRKRSFGQPPVAHAPSPTHSDALDDWLDHALDDWASAAREALRHQVPSTGVLRNILTTGVHILAATDACLNELSTRPATINSAVEIGQPDLEQLAKVRLEVKATALVLQHAADAWQHVTTAMTPGHPYVAASRDLFAALTDTQTALAPRPLSDLTRKAQSIVLTLAHAAPALSARLTTIDALASQLLQSELLFIRARLVPPREEILHERLTGRLVVARERDVPTLLHATHQGRQQTTNLTRLLEALAATLTTTPSDDRQLAARGWTL